MGWAACSARRSTLIWYLLAPARCESAQRAFWEAGLVYESTPGLLLASRPFGRLDRYVPASHGLF